MISKSFDLSYFTFGNKHSWETLWLFELLIKPVLLTSNVLNIFQITSWKVREEFTQQIMGKSLVFSFGINIDLKCESIMKIRKVIIYSNSYWILGLNYQHKLWSMDTSKWLRVSVSDTYLCVRYSYTLKYIHDTCFLIIFLHFLISDTYWTWFFLSSDMYKYLFFDFLIIDYLRSTDFNTIKSRSVSTFTNR